MNLNYKKIIFLIILITGFVFINPCFAQNTESGEQWKDPLDKVRMNTEYKEDTDETTLTDIIANIIKISLSLLGVICVILFIYGGYLWMTAGGNDEQVDKAKQIIKNCLIGLIIVVCSYAITYFIIEKATKVTGEKESHESGFNFDW
ncbi:Mbov_0395 family pilin-like conjugal transfer protein [Patescibacteria group bacterium]